MPPGTGVTHQDYIKKALGVEAVQSFTLVCDLHENPEAGIVTPISGE